MVESKKTHLHLFVFAPLLLLVFRHSNLIRAQEAEFDYRPASEKGPDHWGELKTEWAKCKDGMMQSPIGLLDGAAIKMVPKLSDLAMNHKPSNAIMKNEGHYIAMEWEGDAGSIQIDGTDYSLKSCHWHTPSEHLINGRRYDLELHMVHRSANNDVAVVAFLYQIGLPNPFLSKVNNALISVKNTKEVNLGVIDPREVKWNSLEFFRYMGSLTTPPCTEGVIWNVNERVHPMSIEQLDLLKEAVDDYAVMNARPEQPLNGRDIKLFGPTVRTHAPKGLN